jgi:glycosyltransferase involved in cell wall biosynthesis
MSNVSIRLNDVREDWRSLEVAPVLDFARVRLVSHEEFTSSREIQVEYVAPWKYTKHIYKIASAYHLLHALKMFISTNKNDVMIVNGGVTSLWLWCGVLNRIPLLGNKKMFCWDLFVEYMLDDEQRSYSKINHIAKKIKEKITRSIISQFGLCVLWSKKQIQTHSNHFNLPDDLFIYIPYKANHSKCDTYNLSLNNYIFSGGNGKRDYACLIEAVRGTDIPVIISVTDPVVRKKIEPLPNVVIVGAQEPAFAQLQAASRFVVIPMKYSGLKGGGEANFCNAMWHRKPVIAVDSMSAGDYILDGVTGFVVNSGDISSLREKILFLWNNPDICLRMGLSGRRHIEEYYTHDLFIRRLIRLANLFGNER